MNKIILDPETKRFINTGIPQERSTKYNWDDLVKLYLQEELTPQMIAKIKGCGTTAVRAAIKRIGLPQRNLSEAAKLSYRIGRASNKEENNKNWKGGKPLKHGKYIMIKVKQDNFYRPMATKRGRILEHRLIIAQHLGRCLHPWEVIHHKDGIGTNNQLENLELLPTGRFHLVDKAVKVNIRRLNNKVVQLELKGKALEEKSEQQGKEIRLLKWQLKIKEV